MERDFELEYRVLKQNETPDLWNRIETGLPERFVVKKRTPWKRLGLLAAACLCVVIIFPAMTAGLIGSHKSGSRANSASSAQENTSMTEYIEDTAVDNNMAGGSETAAMEDAGISEEEKLEDVMPEVTDGQILEGAVVQILQVDETEEGTVYQAVVLEADMDAVVESGIQIELICNDETQYDFIREPREEEGLKKEEAYEVSLQYEQDRFVVLTAAKKN